jgi:hypothetical protein
MGAGPLAQAGAGAAERVRRPGHDVDEQGLEPTSPWRAEARTAFELHRPWPTPSAAHAAAAGCRC